jgi:hypothetical protein
VFVEPVPEGGKGRFEGIGKAFEERNPRLYRPLDTE